MANEDFETCKLGVYCTLDGQLQHSGVGRRNGIPTAFFSSAQLDPALEADSTLRNPLRFRRFFLNLNRVERRTWRKILETRSITDIAREEGISRQAVLSRIRGNSKGQGGMISKNYWVLLWWRVRRIFPTWPD